jgi:hypothetical protein
VVIGGALILAIIPRLIQPPLLVLAHMRERRWRNRDPFAPGRPAPVAESGSVPIKTRPEQA